MRTKSATSLIVRQSRYGVQVDAPPAQALRPVRIRAAASTPASADQPAAPASPLGKLLGVYVDPRTWGAAFFILISLVTGVLYFTWAVTGLGLSAGFLILIIGLPFVFLFLLSVRGIALVEARLVQACLGVSVTPPQVFAGPQPNLLQRLKALVTDRNTWSALLYLVLQLPLGVIYFSVTVTLISVALGLLSAPFLYVFTPMPHIFIEAMPVDLPAKILIVLGLAGLLLLTVAMHVIRGIGRWHGRYAKALLAG